MPSSYIIAYTQIGKDTHVLVADKQVISYEAVRRCKNMETWVGVRHSIVNDNRPLSDEGKVLGQSNVGKRFNGILLPSAGKATFPGGHAGRGENGKTAAIREFKEELNLNLDIPEQLLQQIELEDKSITGQYYELDLDKITEEPAKLVQQVNSWINDFESQVYPSGKLQVGQLYRLHRSMNAPELRRVHLVSADVAVGCFDEDNSDWGYIKGQLYQLSSYMCGKLSIRDEIKTKRFSEHLQEHVRNNYPSDWHRNAVEAFVRKRSDTRLNAPPAEQNIVPSSPS